MRRMNVNIGRFRPRINQQVARLGSNDLDAVIDAYGHASRTYFTPERMRREIYFGIFQGDVLVSAAGTHVRSTKSGIAAVGNVLTRLAFRGRGMARSCTSAVTETALQQHRRVVPHVPDEQAPPIPAFERPGLPTPGTFLRG